MEGRAALVHAVEGGKVRHEGIGGESVAVDERTMFAGDERGLVEVDERGLVEMAES